jgi:hypothetical protein
VLPPAQVAVTTPAGHALAHDCSVQFLFPRTELIFIVKLKEELNRLPTILPSWMGHPDLQCL